MVKRHTGAIFDMDGLLFDTEHIYQETWQEIAAERGVTLGPGYTEAISGSSGLGMCRVIERFYHVADGHEIMVECKRRIHEKLSVNVPLKPGAREILDYMRGAGYRIAVASSSTRSQIDANLEHSKLMDCFDAIISGEDVATGKPDPEIFLKAAAALNCPPEECYVFEDSRGGVKAGHAAGCDTIMVPDLLPPTEEIEPMCHRIYKDLREALDDLQNQRL